MKLRVPLKGRVTAGNSASEVESEALMVSLVVVNAWNMKPTSLNEGIDLMSAPSTPLPQEPLTVAQGRVAGIKHGNKMNSIKAGMHRWFMTQGL